MLIYDNHSKQDYMGFTSSIHLLLLLLALRGGFVKSDLFQHVVFCHGTYLASLPLLPPQDLNLNNVQKGEVVACCDKLPQHTKNLQPLTIFFHCHL